MRDPIKYSNQLLILGLILAILTGLGLGYLLFNNGGNEGNQKTDEHVHAFGETIWTCSMHPQIRQNEPGDCPICGMDLIPLETNGSSDPLVLEMTPEAVKLASIETVLIGSTSGTETSLTLSGKIQEDERLAASQVAHIDGRIEKLFVSFEGEKVRKGQRVASLYAPELIAAQRELLEAKKLEGTMPGLLEAARKKLEYWKISSARIQEIEESGKIQETVTLFADASGVVTGRKVAAGDYVKKGEVLLNLVSLDRLWVIFDAYEEDLAHVKKGDQMAFTTLALPGKEFNTRITFIDPIINPTTRVVSIRGEINNRNGLLKPEMFVKGSVQAEAQENQQIRVPKTAVLWTGKRSIVYVKVPEASTPSFRYQEIVLGERIGDQYVVKSGLESGAEVVRQGAFSIDAAAQLNNQQSMMNRLVNVAEPPALGIPDYRLSTPATFQQQLVSLIAPYVQLKDALVKADEAAAASGAQAFISALQQVDMSLVKDSAHLYWMDQLNALNAHGKRISKGNNIENQRKQFGFLSNALIHTIQAFGTQGDTLYIQHCPMAFDNEGADWLSKEKDILNPYFGDMMLRCGSVQDHISPMTRPQNQQQLHNH